jgi:hypothetical protein
MVFAQKVANGSQLVDAYQEAFPDKKLTAEHLRVYAYRLAHNPKIKDFIQTIQQAVRLRFVLSTPDAYEKMVALANNAKSEKVQFEATKEILDRGGLKAPERVESIQIGIFGSMEPEDLKALIKTKLEKE